MMKRHRLLSSLILIPPNVNITDEINQKYHQDRTIYPVYSTFREVFR